MEGRSQELGSGAWEQGWKVGLATEALDSHELGSSPHQTPDSPTVLLAQPWSILSVILVNNNQAFSRKIQTSQPPLCFQELGEHSGRMGQSGVQGQLQQVLGPHYSKLPDV